MNKIFIFLLLAANSYSQMFYESNSGVTVSLNSVSYASSFPVATVWVSGDSGTVLRSPNGTVWTNVRSGPIPSTLSLNVACAFDINNVLVSGTDSDSSYIFMSSNSGSNWIKVFSQPNGYIYSICKTSSIGGVAVGKPINGRWSLWKTTNKGLTWDSTNLYLQQAVNELSWNNSLFCDPSNNFVWFGTNNSRIYRAQNLSNWSFGQTVQQNSFAVFFTGSFGFMGGNYIMSSTNSGNNWTATSSNPSGSEDITSIFYGPIGIFVTRKNNQIHKGLNNGSSWSTVYTAASGNYLHSCYFSSFGGGLIFVRSNGGITLCNFPDKIELLSSEVPQHFSLSQNYPNPFNPTTNFEFRIADFGFVNLTIYDVLGREAATLVNGNLEPGVYKANWDASDFTSGVYFYRLATNEFIETKKMMFIK
ncbi:MAG: T9SS type A sorting domain-containing protein [Ignavibacteria bacterium]|nr:T9SS type A sorting domain-containing protein [Ignavibacteria bacterium]